MGQHVGFVYRSSLDQIPIELKVVLKCNTLQKINRLNFIIIVASINTVVFKSAYYVSTNVAYVFFNLLNTKRRLLYLKSQFVPRSKHF